MLTDEQLTTKPKTARYVVSINHKSKTVPAFWLNCDSPTKKEAMINEIKALSFAPAIKTSNKKPKSSFYRFWTC